MIAPIVLIAELQAQGVDVEWRDGIVHYVGNFDGVTSTLQADLDAGHRDVTAYVSAMQEGTL